MSQLSRHCAECEAREARSFRAQLNGHPEKSSVREFQGISWRAGSSVGTPKAAPFATSGELLTQEPVR